LIHEFIKRAGACLEGEMAVSVFTRAGAEEQAYDKNVGGKDALASSTGSTLASGWEGLLGNL
jgi:hypothetical protein